MPNFPLYFCKYFKISPDSECKERKGTALQVQSISIKGWLYFEQCSGNYIQNMKGNSYLYMTYFLKMVVLFLCSAEHRMNSLKKQPVWRLRLRLRYKYLIQTS